MGVVCVPEAILEKLEPMILWNKVCSFVVYPDVPNLLIVGLNNGPNTLSII